MKSCISKRFEKISKISQNDFVGIVRAAKKLACLKNDLAGFKLDHEIYQAILVSNQSRVRQTALNLQSMATEVNHWCQMMN